LKNIDGNVSQLRGCTRLIPLLRRTYFNKLLARERCSVVNDLPFSAAFPGMATDVHFMK